MPVDRARHGQLVFGRDRGDCFRACISVLLDVPNGDHLPNPHDDMWFFEWRRFLDPFGLEIMSGNPKGPIWKNHRWIADVPSKNLEGCSHAIVMNRTCYVEFDPSPKRRYHPNRSLLGKDIVLGGQWIEVADASKLGAFVRWQRACWRREARAA